MYSLPRVSNRLQSALLLCHYNSLRIFTNHFSELLESMLETSCLFTPKDVRVCFLTRTFSYTTAGDDQSLEKEHGHVTVTESTVHIQILSSVLRTPFREAWVPRFSGWPRVTPAAPSCSVSSPLISLLSSFLLLTCFSGSGQSFCRMSLNLCLPHVSLWSA